jgi:hypothetical protein
MSVSTEAVEAAAKELYFYLREDHRGAPRPWETLADDDDRKIDARDAAKVALEAAAQHLMAQAWDEAMKVAHDLAWEHDSSAASAIFDATNPYRSAGAGE